MKRNYKKTRRVRRTKRKNSKYKNIRKTKRRTRRNRQRGGAGDGGLRGRITRSFNKTAGKARQFARSARSRFDKKYRDKLEAEKGEKEREERERLERERQVREEGERKERENQEREEGERRARERERDEREARSRQAGERIRKREEEARVKADQARESRIREREKYHEEKRQEVIDEIKEQDREWKVIIDFADKLGIDTGNAKSVWMNVITYQEENVYGARSDLWKIRNEMNKFIVKTISGNAKDEREKRIFETPLYKLLDEDVLKNISESFSLSLEDVSKYLDISMKDIGNALSNEEFKEALLIEFGDKFEQELRNKLEKDEVRELEEMALEAGIKIDENETPQTLISKMVRKVNIVTLLEETFNYSIEIIEMATEPVKCQTSGGFIPNNSKVIIICPSDLVGKTGTIIEQMPDKKSYNVNLDTPNDASGPPTAIIRKNCVVLISNVECEKNIGKQILSGPFFTTEILQPSIFHILKRIKNPISPQEANASKTKLMKQTERREKITERKEKILSPINKTWGLMRKKSPDELQGQETQPTIGA